MGYCGDCEYLTSRHNCKKYKKGLTYSKFSSRSISTGTAHERCSECDKDHWIAELEDRIKRQWIPVEERLPEEGINPITQDWHDYEVTFCSLGVYDVRHYKFGRGHWWNGGPEPMDKYVIAWLPKPEPYRPMG